MSTIPHPRLPLNAPLTDRGDQPPGSPAADQPPGSPASNALPEYLPARPGDIRDSHADISLARKLLHYSPVTGFSDGLAETIVWLRNKA